MSRKHKSTKGAFGGHKRLMVKTLESPGQDHVYHFTDTARLPWILESGVLKVDRGAVGKYPTKFVWATTLPDGDPTCATLNDRTQMETFRNGGSRLVRFTFNASDFEPWFNIKHHPDWDLASFEKLDNIGRRQGGITQQWRVRATPLPIEQAVTIETKLHKHPWEPLEKPWWIIKLENTPQLRGIVIHEIVYTSIQLQHPITGQIAYAAPPPQPAALLPNPIAVDMI